MYPTAGSFERLDKPLASPPAESTGYPSPLSDSEFTSTHANGAETDTEDEIAKLHALPRELAVDADTLVRSPRPVRTAPSAPLPSRPPDVHWFHLAHTPHPPATNPTFTLIYHLFVFFFQQIELASKVQTVPQSTGFFSILGGFLVDMSFELSILLWFFIEQVLFPGLVHVLEFILLLIGDLLIVIASPVLVRDVTMSNYIGFRILSSSLISLLFE